MKQEIARSRRSRHERRFRVDYEENASVRDIMSEHKARYHVFRNMERQNRYPGRFESEPQIFYICGL